MEKSGTAAAIGKKMPESHNQLFRCIWLTNLISEPLELEDKFQIVLTLAVELSYLIEQDQYNSINIIDSEDFSPSLSQTNRIKNL